MTHEGQGPRPDEDRSQITPPTSTRWSEEPVEDTPDLAPPFVGGRRTEDVRGPGAESLTRETADAVTAPEPSAAEPTHSDEPAPFPFDAEPDAEAEPATPAAEEDDFPFDQFDIDGDDAAVDTEPAEPVEPEVEGSDLSGAWITEAPVDDVGDGEMPIEALEAEPADEEPEPWGELPEEPAPWAETVAEAVDAAPALEAEVDSEPALEGGEEAGPAASGPGEEMASLLERLARTIREEGEAGVRREIDSADRITSLIAGLLAGHLSARS